ncbi:TOX high mobility group box family member 3 [Triplophysa dalaica]|uniref:TOX high mobility group box family member 3 n=1 Tax=Triplophysa dalaica TaxID=1582913 RepID=UPI0024DFF89F|nr:TOX high mobility group box family member 3 [Triplophysa dalaica]
MDVFYPSAGGNSIPRDPQNLDFSHCLGYYNYNKFGNNNNYMNMADANGALLGADTFHTPSLGDEEFEIPPITPPPEVESGMGLQEVGSTYPGLPDHPNPHRGSFTPQFPPQSLELPSITISRNMMEQEGGQMNNGHPGGIGQTHLRQYAPNPTMVMRSIINMHNPNGMMSQNQLSTLNQSQINTQLGLNMTGSNIAHTSPSPPASKSATPSPSSSINEDDQEEGNRVIGEKRPAPDAGKKPKTPKKKKKKDPNEPQKPVSAYALFFRDTQAAIKGQNPNATFGEVSKIVASMWDGLGEEQKQTYKSKTEAAKKEYLKALAAYRASLVSKAAAESAEAQTIRSVQQTLASTSLSPGLVLPSPLSQHPSMSAAAQALQQALPRAIAPKPLQMRVGGSQIVTSVAVAHQSMAPGGLQSQLLGQMGTAGPQSAVSSQMSPPMQPRHATMQQQMQQQHQMQQHLQHHQMQQQQMHHQQIQQQMQQQHFQHHLQQQLQQHQMQQQHQQMQQQQMQMQHMQQMQHMHQHQMQQHQMQSQPQSQCSPVQHSPGTPHPASLGSPPPPPQPQPHPSQVQAHAQVLSQVSIY